MIYYSFAISIFLHFVIFVLGGMLPGSTPAQANNSRQLITVFLYQNSDDRGVTEKVKEVKLHKTEVIKKPSAPVANEMVTPPVLPETPIDMPQIVTTVAGISTAETNFVGQDIRVQKEEIPLPTLPEVLPPASGGYCGAILNHVDNLLQEYIRKVKARIERNKKYPQVARRQGIAGVVTVQFCISKDGRLKGVEIVSSSGCKILDDEAVRSVKATNPFLCIPEEIKKEELSLKVDIVFKLEG